MAVTKTVLKASEAEAIVKITGVNGDSATIALDTDILAASQVVGSDQQTVNIAGFTWTGAAGSSIQIKRSNTIIATLLGETSSQFDFSGQAMCAESTNHNSDIVVEISGGQAEIWLRLKKIDGYRTFIEYDKFGSYDDETKIGAVDLNNGSPGYNP